MTRSQPVLSRLNSGSSLLRWYYCTNQDQSVNITVQEPLDLPTSVPTLPLPSVPRKPNPTGPGFNNKDRGPLRQRRKVDRRLADRTGVTNTTKATKRKCSICNIVCNSNKTFFDHRTSRKQLNAVANKKNPAKCIDCKRSFESQSHLTRHLAGKQHLKVVARRSD